MYKRQTVERDSYNEKIGLIKESKENLLISEVEKIWEQIDLYDNWELLNQKIKKLRNLGDLLESQKIVNF